VGKPGLPLALAFPLESPRPTSDVEVDLIVKDIPRDSVVVGQPFLVQFKLTVLASPPPAGEQRILSLVVQHVRSAVPDQARAGLPSSAQTLPPGGPFSPQLPSAISAASVASIHHDKTSSEASRDDDTLHLHHSHLEQVAAPLLPPPYARSGASRADGITFAGPSALFLPPIQISRSDRTSGPPVETDDLKTKALVVQDFELSYVPVQKGFTTIGGLRVLLVGDKAGHGEGTEGGHREARILRDWDVVGEVWVKTF
jgi:trafficking protein particle complex subunit 13